jgi:glutamate-1-semialdehyde aminotransferase
MNDMSNQIKKAVKNLKQELSWAAHEVSLKAAAPLLTALEREVESVFMERQGKSEDELRIEVRAAAGRAGVELEEHEVKKVASTILSGEQPTFIADVRITGLD